MSKYPKAIDPNLVGEYPAHVKSGAGYFYDDVLEYRVWCHPEKGAPDEHRGEDYFFAFQTFEEALDFSKNTTGAEQPLVLIRQFEWVNEPSAGNFIHLTGERMAEWLPEWLEGGARQPGQIETFIKNRSAHH